MEKMIVVTDIKIAEVERDYFEFYKYQPPSYWVSNPVHLEPIDQSIEIERVYGQRFYTGKGGKEVVIGLCKDAQEALGLPMDCFESLSNENAQLIDKSAILSGQVHLYRNMSLWKRIKFLFNKQP